ncbi:MAG: hypothetical protein ACI8V2_002867 [Candidatus Latescibacterota bacterium]
MSILFYLRIKVERFVQSFSKHIIGLTQIAWQAVVALKKILTWGNGFFLARDQAAT